MRARHPAALLVIAALAASVGASTGRAEPIAPAASGRTTIASALSGIIADYGRARLRVSARVDGVMRADRKAIMRRCGRLLADEDARYDDRATTVIFLALSRRGWQRERTLLRDDARKLVSALKATGTTIGRNYATVFLAARDLAHAAPANDVCGYVERLAGVGYDSTRTPEAERIDAYVTRIGRFERRERALLRQITQITRRELLAPLDLIDLVDDRVLPPNVPLTKALRAR